MALSEVSFALGVSLRKGEWTTASTRANFHSFDALSPFWNRAGVVEGAAEW